MCKPDYEEFVSKGITMDVRPDGSEVRVIAGTTDNGISGPVIDFMEPHKREQLS